jgi:hypothetical protein
MKPTKLMCINAMALFTLLAIPVGLAAQGQPSNSKRSLEEQSSILSAFGA